MQKIFVILLAFSFLFSLGQRQDRKEFEIYKINFNDEIRDTKSWSVSDGKWSSSAASIPEIKGYKIKGYDNCLILDINSYSYHDLFIFDMSKISSSIFPLKENKLETITVPYIYLETETIGAYDLKAIESIINSIFSTDELPSSTGYALYIDYYNYKDNNGAKMTQYALRYDSVPEYSFLDVNNEVYTNGYLSDTITVEEEHLLLMFSKGYYEASYEYFYHFLHDFLSPYLKSSAF